MSYRRPHTPEDREAALRLIDRVEAALRGVHVERASTCCVDTTTVVVQARVSNYAAWITSGDHDYALGIEGVGNTPSAALRALRDRLTGAAAPSAAERQREAQEAHARASAACARSGPRRRSA